MADILLVDDGGTEIHALIIQREVGDYELREFTNALEAIEYARDNPPMLVTCDGRNVITGLDVARILRDDPRTSLCRFILVAAHHLFVKQARQNDNVDDSLTKPFAPGEFSTVVKKQLSLLREHFNPSFLLLNSITFLPRLQETTHNTSQWTYIAADVRGLHDTLQCRRFGGTVRSAFAAYGTPEDYAGCIDEDTVGIVTFSRSPELILDHLTTEWKELNIQYIR
ncbi:MAG: hypothetical protein L0154_06590 [Chloroflexi bacterium]|nr:hypothetical protein [Chloroflexota bacterium]